MDVITTDILIIGAGGAGLRAAIEAKEMGQNVLLVGKEVLGCAHTGMAMGGLNAALVAPATSQFHFDITLEGGYFINNQKIVRAFADEMPERVHDLERYGVIFDRTDAGEFYVWAGPKQKHPLNVCVGDYTGREMMQGLVDQARKIGLAYHDEFFVTRLFVQHEQVCGAFGYDLKTGGTVLIYAKAVILATGGAGRMYEVTTNAASNTGDGYAIALEAGADLIDMEMVQFHPTGMAHPPSSRGVLITEKVRAHGGILRNRDGERFMQRYFPKEMELAKRDEVSRSIYQEVAAGRGTKRNGVYLHVDHLSVSEILDKFPDVHEIHRNIGIDITKEPMEVYPSMHHMMGGVLIDEWARSSIPGLFACGEVAGGVHGANRLGGNSIAEGQVFGRRAALSAGEFIEKQKKIPAVSPEDIKKEQEKFQVFLVGSGTPPHEIETMLKKTMWENVGIFRDEAGLKKAQKRLQVLQTEAKNMRCRSKHQKRNRDLQDCFEVLNMLKTADAVVQAALLRTESRGRIAGLIFQKLMKIGEKTLW